MPVSAAAYTRQKKRVNKRQREQTLVVQDIAPCPPVKDPARRARADGDYRFFCETYFPRLFTLPWSEDHLKVIAKIERVVIHNEMFAMRSARSSPW